MTFKSFPLSSDMVSVSDEDYNGISGGEWALGCLGCFVSPLSWLTIAHRILLQITANIHRLDASHNSIGTAGAVSLFDGLASARRRFSSNPGAELWGMTEINLARNEIGDDGFTGAMYYVSKDQAMRSLLMQANRITVSRVYVRGLAGELESLVSAEKGPVQEQPMNCQGLGNGMGTMRLRLR